MFPLYTVADHIFKLFLAKFAENVSFAHLTGAVDDQRQPIIGFILPCKQLFFDFTLHFYHLMGIV